MCLKCPKIIARQEIEIRVKKIYFRHIMVEITRRCQLKCEHCLRGDAQDLDISNDIIDAILEQTAGIGRLSFTGGEPTLAPDKMNYFVDRMIEKGIPLGGISYITNGVELSEEVKEFLVKAHLYITKSRENDEIFRSDCKIFFQPRIRIGLSLDNYHVDNEKVKREYERFLPTDSCYVTYENNSIPIKAGRGKSLKYGHSLESTGRKDKRPQIGMEYKSHHLICDDSPRSETMLQFCDAFIPCFLEMTAVGRLFPAEARIGEYKIDDCTTENVICQFSNGELPSIFDSLVEYNKRRKLCYITAGSSPKLTVDDLNALKMFEKTHNTDTRSNKWPEGFDRLFSDDIKKAELDIAASQMEYLSRYKSYLSGRIQHYSDIEEVKKDFPNTNDHFCGELLDKIANNSAEEIVEWIISTKYSPWYYVDDALYESAKYSHNQIIMNEYKKERDKIMQSDMPQPIKAAMNKELLKAAREQLAK